MQESNNTNKTSSGVANSIPPSTATPNQTMFPPASPSVPNTPKETPKETIKQPVKTRNFFKENFDVKNKNFLAPFLASFGSLLVLLIILFGIAWGFRGKLFGSFAREYLQDVQDQNALALTGDNVLEKQTIFSQEHFVVDAVKKTNPAVVSIIISKEVPKYEAYVDPNQNYNPFGNFFGLPQFNLNLPQYRQNGTEKKDVGGGSGFFVSSDGLIVTNKHVVDQKNVEYTVFTNDGKKQAAKVIAEDPVLDIALLKVEGTDFPFLNLGSSDNLEVGQSVIAIGNALAEFRNTVSVGVISGLSRSITANSSSGGVESLDHVIQTDAAINPGNSGGPLLDLSGRVVGVNVAIAQGSQNIGFALPINSIKGAIESVKATGKIVRPYLGVRYTAVTAEIAEKNNLTVDYGALVKAGESTSELAVMPGSPADKAGIVENDIILEVDGMKLDEDTNLASVIRSKSVGQVINLKILHKGEEKTVAVTLEAAKDK